MDRDLLIRALAQHAGKTLTPEIGRAIADALCAAPAPIDPATFGALQTGSTTIRAERLVDILDEMHVLHEAHWAETERHRHGLAMAPDYAAMLAEESAGTLIQFTARQDGRLVGNCRVYLRTSRHTNTRYMVEDTLYLLPEARRGRTAIRLLQFVDDAMRRIGVLELRANAKLVNGTARLLEAQGWQPVATEFVKFLKEDPHVQ